MKHFRAFLTLKLLLLESQKLKKHNYPLTEREQQVLKVVAKGNANRETAQELEISTETVKKHLKKIYSKLEVRNKIEALNKMKMWL